MENGMVTIAKYDYDSLLRKAERIAAVERLVNSDDYVSEKNILTVLGIEKKKESTENG